MLGDTVGYAQIKASALGQTGVPLSNFRGRICRVMEFAQDGGVLVIDPQATGLAMFDKEHISGSFKCTESGHYICPPDCNVMDQMLYVNRCMMRKGGYNQVVRSMVIAASVARGKFTDNFLWQVECDEARVRAEADARRSQQEPQTDGEALRAVTPK